MTTTKTLETKKGAKFEIEISDDYRNVALISFDCDTIEHGRRPLTPVNHPKSGWCFRFWHEGKTAYLQSDFAREVKEQMDVAQGARKEAAAALGPNLSQRI